MTPPAFPQPAPLALPHSGHPSGKLLEDLYRSHRGWLLRMCARWLDDPWQAEDVVHDTLLKAWSSFSSYDPKRPIWFWLAAIARRSCIDFQRRTTSRLVLNGLDLPEMASADTTLSEVLNRAECRQLRFCLNLLPQRQRRALLLRVDGWSYPEIASLEGVSVKAARQIVVRARSRLRESMDPPEGKSAGG